MIALHQTAPKKAKYTNTKHKLKRTENALWEELNRPQKKETIRVATYGSHTKGQVAGWGAAVWEEGKSVTELFGPVILGERVLNPFGFGANAHSNNTGEMQAACEGFLEVMHREPNSIAWIYDSELTCSVATGKSFIKGETELCDNLRKLFLKVSERAKHEGGLRCEHVYSHFGHTENEVADVLADKGVTERCATGRFLPGYQGMSQDIDILNDVVNPPRPELDLVKTWSVMTDAIRETQDLILPKRTGRKRKQIKPSQDTLRLEKRLREEGGKNKLFKQQLGQDLIKCRKSDREKRDKSVLSDMKTAFDANDVAGVASCMDTLAGTQKFCTVQPMNRIEKDAEGKVKVLGGFESTKEMMTVWQNVMEKRFAARPGDENRMGDTLSEPAAMADCRFSELTRSTFDRARIETKDFKAAGEDKIQGAVWNNSDIAADGLFLMCSEIWRRETFPGT